MSYRQALVVNSLHKGDAAELQINPFDWNYIQKKLTPKNIFSKVDYGKDNFLLHGIPVVENVTIKVGDMKIISKIGRKDVRNRP